MFRSLIKVADIAKLAYTRLQSNLLQTVSYIYLQGPSFRSKEELASIVNFREVYDSILRNNLCQYSQTELLEKWHRARMEKEACTDIETCVLQNIEDEPIFLCDKETSAEVYIIYDRKQKTVYITFRGTDDLKDWAYNLDINMEEITITSPLLMDTKVKPLVHSGFLTKFKALSSKIETSLDAFDFSTMVISGHSLGGALATIGSIHFQLMYPSVSITLYVFGSPRCGNKEFTKLVEEKIDKYCRIVNETDPVNELPFCKDFHHIKNCLTIKGNGTARLSDKDTPWSKRLISMLMALDIGDHLLFSGYLTNLKKFL